MVGTRFDWENRTGHWAQGIGHGAWGAGIWLAAALACILALLSGCAAATRNIDFGPLENGVPLVSLVVTEDLSVVQRECSAVRSEQSILGCEITRIVALPDQKYVRAVTVVQYTDSLPSAMAFEIQAHELCHAIAIFQPIGDPCHNGNGGVLQSAMPSARSQVNTLMR